MLVLVITMSVGVVMQYVKTEGIVRDMLGKNLDSSSMLVANGLNNITILVLDHSNDYEFWNGTAEEKTAHAQMIAAYDDNVNNLIFMDSDGTSYNGEIPQNVISALNSASTVITTPANGQSNFYLAVKRSDGAILCSDMKVSKLATFLNGAACDTFILAEDGTVIASSVSDGTAAANYSGFVQKSGGRMIDTTVHEEHGTLYCFAATVTDDTNGWTVIIRTQSANYYSGLMVAFIADVIIIGLMVLLIVMVNVFISGSILKPLENVRAKITEMVSGNLSGAQINIRSNDEMGELSHAVNTMADFNRNIIGDISYYAEEIAKQNLCVKPKAQYVGDYQPIKQSLERIVESLSEVVANIENAGREVSTSSAQMSANSAVLSQAAAEEADTVSQLNDSLHNVHDQISDSAGKAAQARDMTEQAVTAMNEGNEKMARMLEAMNEINTTSSQIANIIKTIQDISFQTNILSLNASIEAARAGAAGKGFAVVAGEVGNLANKTAQAAKSTTGLIETSLKAVEHGTVIANETAEMLGMIVEKAGESAKVVEEIADASTHQAESVKQVLEGMNGISSAVNQISVSAKECADSSDLLATQSTMLHDTVDKFILDSRSVSKASAPVKTVSEPKPASNPASAPKPVQSVSKPVTSAPKPAAKKTISLPDDEPAKTTAPAPKPAASAPKSAAGKSKTVAPKKTISLPDDEPAKTTAPAPKPAAPKSVSTPVARPASKPVIKLDDDEGVAPAPTGKVLSKATMQPVKRTIRMDNDKY